MTHCPREHCGGLLLTRSVQTDEGCLEETYCASCSRLYTARSTDPYRPCRVRFSESVEAFLDVRRVWEPWQRRDASDPASSSSFADPEISHTGGSVSAHIVRALPDDSEALPD